jgi:gluconokinase
MPDAATPPPLHLVVMGVAACGKSVVATQLAQRLGLPLVDADDFHSPASIAKIEHDLAPGEPEHREWMHAVAQQLRERPGGAILACAALRRADRVALRAAAARLHFLHLALTPHQALERMAARTDQFYPPSVAARDVESLEDPAQEALVHVADGTLHVDRIVDETLRWLSLRGVGSASA